MAKVHSLITLNKSSDSKCKFCITKSWKNSSNKHFKHEFSKSFEMFELPKHKLSKGETGTV